MINYKDGGNSDYGTSIIYNFYSEYDLTFATQASAPTEAFKPKALDLPATELVPDEITYNGSTGRIELDYPLHDFKFTPNIRQLKYFMRFNKIGNSWLKFLANLWKSE